MTPLLKTALMPYGTAYAIEPGAARQIEALLQGVDMAAHMREFRKHLAEEDLARSGRGGDDSEGSKGYEMNGSVAILPLSGPLTKQTSSLQMMMGGTGTVQFCADLDAAVADPAAQSILIVIDSPGGSVDGTEEMYQCIRDAAAKKPVYAYASDLCASAAYYAACGASAFYAGPAAMVGSIGCYTVLTDSSKAAEMSGRQVVVIGDGEMKGTGVSGTPVTDAQKADISRVIKDRNQNFVQAVAKGRKIPIAQARSVADGRLHIGAKAQSLGLTDGTMRLPELLAKIQADPKALIPTATTHPNARLGNNNAQKAQENLSMKTHIAAALAALGLHSMAGKAMATPDDDDQALASSIAADMKAEVDAQVKAHPLVAALATAQVTTPEQLAAMTADAALWRGLSAKKRDEAKANAKLAFVDNPDALATAMEDIEATADGPAFDRLCARLDAAAPAKDGAQPQTKATQNSAVLYARPADSKAPTPEQDEARKTELLGATTLGRSALNGK